MELLFAIAIGILTAGGIYLLLRPTIFALILGLALLGYAVNLFLFAMGRLTLDAAPIIGAGERYADPLPQALVLTAIVIGFAMTAFVVALALRARSEWGDDRSEFASGPAENSIAENLVSKSAGFESARHENSAPANQPGSALDPQSSEDRG